MQDKFNELITVTLNQRTWFKILDKLNKAATEDRSWGGCVIIHTDHTLEQVLYCAMVKGEKKPKITLK